MIDLAKLIRTDRGLSINETLIREEVTRIIELEADIANVSSTLWIFGTSKKTSFSLRDTAPCFITASYNRMIICANDISQSLWLQLGAAAL